MRITLASGEAIGQDRLITGVLRYDGTPVVASLEFQCILNAEFDQALQEGSTLFIGDQYVEFVIIKRAGVNSQFIKDGQPLSVGAYIAILSGCEKLIVPAAKAIMLKDSSIGSALRASGNKIKVIEDVPIIKYFCAVGATPTYEIARKMQEEAAIPFLNAEGGIIIRRLSNVMDAEPKLQVSASSVNWVNNTTELKHTIPNYLSVNADGSTIEGELQGGVKTGFYPNMDARRLKNLRTVLVTRGTIMRSYMPNLMTGNLIAVDGKRYCILTAAHRYDTGVLGGPTVSASKLWIAEVFNA